MMRHSQPRRVADSEVDVKGKAVLFGLTGFGNTALRALVSSGFEVGLVLTRQEPQFCGVTLPHLTSKAFAGDIAAQRKVEADAKDTDGTLRRTLAAVAGEMVAEAAAMLARGEELPRTPQDERGITFFPPRTRR